MQPRSHPQRKRTVAAVRHWIDGFNPNVGAFINVAVAEKLSALRVEGYFQERAARADIPKALRILKRAGKGKPPVKGDEFAK